MEYISIDSKDRTTDNNVEFSEDINLNQMSINNDVITIRHNNNYQDGDNINVNFPSGTSFRLVSIKPNLLQKKSNDSSKLLTLIIVCKNFINKLQVILKIISIC